MNFEHIYQEVALAFVKGGDWMYGIAAVGVIALAVALHKVLMLHIVYPVNSEPFMAQILKLIAANNIDRAIKVCQVKKHAALPQIIRAGLMKTGKPIEDVEGAMDETSLKIIPKINGGLIYLAMVANVSTLIGLLGTITGLIAAFGAIAVADASQKQAMLAKGISEAMYCTAFGLLVAIPCIMLHSYFTTRASKIVDDIDRYSVSVINSLSEQYRTVRNKTVTGVMVPPPSAFGPQKGI